MNFQDKVIWVTGASSGIGEALAVQWSMLGAKVVLSARRKEELERVAKICTGDTLVLPLDLTDHDSFDDAVSKVIDTFGRIDILVNNGGISQRANAADTAMDIDRKIFEINYFGHIALTKKVLPIFRKQKFGHFVVTSSIVGKFGFYLRSTYSATKHALHGFYESLRLEEEDNGINVNMILPGSISTSIAQNAFDKKGEKHGKKEERLQEGMSPEVCARKIIKAVRKNRKEALIGGKEILMVRFKKWMPWLFYKLIRKQKPSQ